MHTPLEESVLAYKGNLVICQVSLFNVKQTNLFIITQAGKQHQICVQIFIHALYICNCFSFLTIFMFNNRKNSVNHTHPNDIFLVDKKSPKYLSINILATRICNFIPTKFPVERSTSITRNNSRILRKYRQLLQQREQQSSRRLYYQEQQQLY